MSPRDDVIPTINEAKAAGAQANDFLASPMFSINAADLVRHVTTLRLPSIYQWREDAGDGALTAYGPSHLEMYRETARISVKVLGAGPADIPVAQPTPFGPVINPEDGKGHRS